MERILSKDEIAELLSAVKHGEIETGDDLADPGVHHGVKRLDLVGGPGLGRWKIPNLDLIFESIGRNYGISLTNRLQRPVTVKYGSSDSLEFEDCLQGTPEHSAIGIMDLSPLRSGGLVVFDSTLSFMLLELLLGGGIDGKVTALQRPMTSIEANLLKGLMDSLCPDLQKAFDPVQRVQSQIIKIESNPRLVSIVNPEAGVLVVRFTVCIEELTGSMFLVFPHTTLDPLREKLRDSALSADLKHNDSWPRFLRAGVTDLEADLSAQLGVVTLRVRDILNFQAGDVIDLGCPPDAPLKVKVEGKTKFLAVAGARNGSKAIRITGKIERS